MSTHSNASLLPVFLPAFLATIAKSYMYCNDSFGSAGATLTGTSISGEQNGEEKFVLQVHCNSLDFIRCMMKVW
jgi:hypothetical protein